MNASEALGRLKKLGVPAATTSDAAAVLGLSSSAASQTLRRLAAAGLITAIRKGLWALTDQPDRLSMIDYISAPYPGYVSLQSALYQHGMIEQIPSLIYVVTLARTARIRTPLATYSLHHVQPAFFDGYDSIAGSAVKLATPEKALVDFLYLSPTRGRLFAVLPELQLPQKFSRKTARQWARRIPSLRVRTIVERSLNDL
jgi:predicted transcriptional regulator of viral defense system